MVGWDGLLTGALQLVTEHRGLWVALKVCFSFRLKGTSEEVNKFSVRVMENDQPFVEQAF